MSQPKKVGIDANDRATIHNCVVLALEGRKGVVVQAGGENIILAASIGLDAQE